MARIPSLAALTALLGLAGTPMDVLAGSTTLRAPGTVDPGQAVTVTVDGGGAGGRVEIWGPDTGQGFADLAGTQAAGDGAAALTAPGRPGTYELRYLDSAGRVLARTSLDVAAVPISLSLPDPMGAGYDARIEWRGPAAAGDMIQIVDPATGHIVSETAAAGRVGALNIAVLRAPEAVGRFELRYWHAASRTVLRELPIEVGKGTAWLRAPVEVVAGRRFTVEWRGPVGTDQAYELVDPATGAVLDSHPATDASGAAGPVRLTAPRRPGPYRVRFVNTGSGFVIADLPLDVDRN